MNLTDDIFKYSLKTVGYCKVQNCIKDTNLISDLVSDLDKACDEDQKNIESYNNYRFYDIVHQLIDRGESFIDLMQLDSLNHYFL